jgi:uncharacterized membrane protein
MAIQENPYLPPAARVSDVAEVEGDFMPGGRRVPLGHGARWFASGWRMFREQPGQWALIGLALIGITIVLAFVPGVGGIAMSFLMPIFIGGLMLACRRSESGERVVVNDLFTVFRGPVVPIVTAAALGLGLTFGAVIAATIVTFGIVFGVGASGPEAWGIGALFFALVFLALVIPVQMALWFAPALIVFQGVTPMQALTQSFQGCLKNIMPFLLYGLIALPLAILATLPVFLGWIALIPVVIGSLYASYRDIYLQA